MTPMRNSVQRQLKTVDCSDRFMKRRRFRWILARVAAVLSIAGYLGLVSTPFLTTEPLATNLFRFCLFWVITTYPFCAVSHPVVYPITFWRDFILNKLGLFLMAMGWLCTNCLGFTQYGQPGTWQRIVPGFCFWLGFVLITWDMKPNERYLAEN